MPSKSQNVVKWRVARWPAISKATATKFLLMPKRVYLITTAPAMAIVSGFRPMRTLAMSFKWLASATGPPQFLFVSGLRLERP
ncbi:hypothetical protein [Allosphingosinicella vermicomposti]|uniref:hypothetical protein n=1 Tax=Allosphingosinicella vermicomposti TaxID=614671 RepID=UPI00131A53FF|nr:hypothetical protein [Allosphingosinicella vermicomposti]